MKPIRTIAMLLGSLLLSTSAIQSSAVIAAASGALPNSFSGEIHYAGTFRMQMPTPTSSPYYGQAPNLEWNGQALISVSYYGNQVYGHYTGANGFEYGSFQGTRNGNQCVVRDIELDTEWTGTCDMQQFTGFFESMSTALPYRKGRYDTTFSMMGESSLPKKAFVSTDEVSKYIAFGDAGSRPKGWWTVMPPDFGKYFPPRNEAMILDQNIEAILVGDLENYVGAKLIPYSFSHNAYYQSAAVPGEIWVRMNFKYQSAFGPEDGWVEVKTVSGQVVCLRMHHLSECKTPMRSIAEQRSSLARFSPKLGPISIPESCFRYEEVAGTLGNREVIGNDPNGAPIERVRQYATPGYTKRIYTCPTTRFVLECRWGQYAPTLTTGEDVFPFSQRSINDALASGDCVRTQ